MKTKLLITVVVTLATAFLGACTTSPALTEAASSGPISAELQLQRSELALREENIAGREAALRAREQELKVEREELKAVSAEIEANAAISDTRPLPHNPQPGKCYAQVHVDARFKATNSRIQVKDPSWRIEIIPAKYETVDESVVIREPSSRIDIVKAEYETVEVRVEVKPAIYETRIIDAVWETKTVQVLNQAAHTEWKRVTGVGSNLAARTIDRFGDYNVLETRLDDSGNLMCLVEIPDDYKDVETVVLVTPASTEEVEVSPAVYEFVMKTIEVEPATTSETIIPAVYEFVMKTIEVEPATTSKTTIPAEYETVRVTTLAEPARAVRTKVPADFTMVTSNQQIRGDRIKWQSVMCEVNMTRENIIALQKALNEEGGCFCGPRLNKCEEDGIMGTCTLKGVQRYAESNDLPWGSNYISTDVVEKLGLSFQ